MQVGALEASKRGHANDGGIRVLRNGGGRLHMGVSMRMRRATRVRAQIRRHGCGCMRALICASHM